MNPESIAWLESRGFTRLERPKTGVAWIFPVPKFPHAKPAKTAKLEARFHETKSLWIIRLVDATLGGVRGKGPGAESAAKDLISDVDDAGGYTDELEWALWPELLD